MVPATSRPTVYSCLSYLGGLVSLLARPSIGILVVVARVVSVAFKSVIGTV